jgi:hypothetical protein
MGNRTDDKTQEINRISMMDRNKTSYKEGKKEETGSCRGSPVFMYKCVSRNREGLALVSVTGAEP